MREQLHVIQYLGPALIVVWVCLRMKRLPEKKEVLGVILAVTGIFLIATHGNPTSLALSQKALIMGLISAVSVVIYTVKPARLQAQFDTPLVLAWGMLIGGAVLMVVFRPWNYQVIFDRETFAAVAFIILFGTMAGFSMYLTGSKDDRFRKSQPRFLRGTGGLHGINCSLDESQLHNTGSDRNSVCNCHDHNPGSSNEEKTE